MGRSDTPLLVLGTRTLAVEIADLASETPGFRVAGFVENMDPSRCRESLEGLPILWVGDMPGVVNTHVAVCGLATTQRSRFIEQVIAYAVPFATLVHPSARISTKSSVGEGTVVSVGVIVGAHSRLGRHVLVNRGALIGHHTELGDYVTIQPGVNIGGACSIGEGTYIGMGAIVIDHITVGAHSIVGAGAVVTKNVPDDVMVVGRPARTVKRNVFGK